MPFGSEDPSAPIPDPTGLLPGPRDNEVTFDMPIAVSEKDSIGREPTTKTLREEKLANTVQPDTALAGYVPAPVALFADSTKRAFRSGDNMAYELFKRGEREWASPAADPSYNADDFIKAHRGHIPPTQEMQFHLATSQTEASYILQDLTKENADAAILEKRGGISTFVARGLAGIVDIDTPLIALSGGMAEGLKGGVLATKWGRIASNSIEQGVGQAAGQAVAVEAGTTGDWTSIPAAGLGGMAFGMIGASLKGHGPEIAANDGIKKAVHEFDDYVADGAPLANHDIRTEAHLHSDPYGSVRAQEAAQAATEAQQTASSGKDAAAQIVPDTTVIGSEITGEAPGSLGARQMNSQGTTATIESPRVQQTIADAKARDQSLGVSNEYNSKYVGLRAASAAGDAVAKVASRFHDMIEASPLATDFSRMWRSGSTVAHMLAYDLFESASGIVRNNRSAAALMEMYKNQLGAVSDHVATAKKLFDKENGISVLDSITNTEALRKFNRDVQTELSARAWDQPGTPSTASPSVRLAADAIDAWSKMDIAIGQGRIGETAIKGYELLKSYSGYFPQKWSGAAIERMIREGGKTKKDIIDAVSEAYQHMHRIQRADADIFAAAMVNKARRSEQGLDVNLIGTLQDKGEEYLAEALHANGISAANVDKLIDKLKGASAERGQLSQTKGRIDVDMRFKASNGISMLDLVDNDVQGILARRVRGTAGAAALARKGIASKADIEHIIETILQEQQARGKSVSTGTTVKDKFDDFVDKDRHLTREHLDAMFTNFGAGPISGGVNPYVGAAMKLTNLALLPQLGLTQMAEVGAQIASVGLKRWYEHAGGAIRGNAINPQSALADELKHMGVMVPEEKYFRNDMNLDMDRQGPASSWFAQKMTSTLNSAQHIAGYSSGYYAVRNFQQRVAATSAADKIMQNMAGLRNDLSTMRAEDIGLDARTYARVKSYVDNGTVEFKDGSLYKTNFDKWKPEDAEDFTLALNRHVSQVVQKAMAGESSILFHKDGLASLFYQMKHFTMLSVEKQFLRNVRAADPQTTSTFLAGLATAAAAYSVKQAINGNSQNLSIDRVARGAIGYSNMTGWLPMWIDPVSTMLGMDALRIGSYGSRGQQSSILSYPAALTTMNKMLSIPAIPGHALTGHLSNNDVRALQATPIIGSAYGMTALLNGLKK